MISILRIGPIMVFDTYHRMISKGTYWAGPCLIVLKPALVGISDLVFTAYLINFLNASGRLTG